MSIENKQKSKGKSAKGKALSLLAKRSYFSKELFSKLEEKGWGKEEIEKTLQELIAIGLLNDEEESARFIARKKRQGYGTKVIAYQLQEKGGMNLPLSETKEELQELIEKKYRKKLPEQKQKVIQALSRRGFSYGLILETLSGFR